MRFSLFAIPAVLVAGFGLQASPLQVTGVRAWSYTGITRVAIEVDGDFTFRSDRAHNPERIFFDVIGAAPRFDGRRLLRKDINDKLIKRVRVAETQPGVTRIVLDLAGPVSGGVTFSASQLSNPSRLIVELRAPSNGPPAIPPTITQAQPPAAVTVVQTVATNRPVPTPVLSPTDTAAAAATSAPAPQAIPDLPPPPAMRARGADLNVSPSLTRALGLKVNRIVIDAGHGGHDQGTAGPGGLLEKDLVLDVALRLGKLIEQRMGAEVVYTRSDDTFVPLEERTAIANRNHADLFLSIHANSSSATEVAGVETYYLNFTNSPDAMDVAARENAASSKSIFELKDLIQKISLHDKLEESREFASSVQTSLQNFNAKSFPSARNRGVRKAPFVVLIGASMPSILTEIGFLTNSRQEKLLSKPDYRQKLAEALYRGLANYNQTLSHVENARQARVAEPVTGSTR